MSYRRFVSIKLVLVVFLTGTLSACAVKSNLVGSKWVVIGKIEVPPNKTGITFQYGKPVARISADQYKPWCHLVMQDKVDAFRTITAGSYEINRVVFANDPINEMQTSFKTTMRLTSSASVPLFEITCGNWDDNSGSYLTHEQMEQAVNGLMKLEITPQNNK